MYFDELKGNYKKLILFRSLVSFPYPLENLDFTVWTSVLALYLFLKIVDLSSCWRRVSIGKLSAYLREYSGMFQAVSGDSLMCWCSYEARHGDGIFIFGWYLGGEAVDDEKCVFLISNRAS